MADGRGGARPGAGRKPGATTSKAAELRNKILQTEGITPLEAMIANLRWYWEQALADAPRPGGCGPDPVYWRLLAEEVAAKSAVYIHPRLSTVEAKVEGEMEHRCYVSAEPPTPQEWLELYGHKDEAETS